MKALLPLLLLAASCSDTLAASAPAGTPAPAYTPAETGSLTGIACGPTGLGLIEGALVLVLPPGEHSPDEALHTAVTDSAGAFAVGGLPEGNYDLRLAKGALQGSVLGLHVAAGRSCSASVDLR